MQPIDPEATYLVVRADEPDPRAAAVPGSLLQHMVDVGAAQQTDDGFILMPDLNGHVCDESCQDWPAQAQARAVD